MMDKALSQQCRTLSEVLEYLSNGEPQTPRHPDIKFRPTGNVRTVPACVLFYAHMPGIYTPS